MSTVGIQIQNHPSRTTRRCETQEPDGVPVCGPVAASIQQTGEGLPGKAFKEHQVKWVQVWDLFLLLCCRYRCFGEERLSSFKIVPAEEQDEAGREHGRVPGVSSQNRIKMKQKQKQHV